MSSIYYRSVPRIRTTQLFLLDKNENCSTSAQQKLVRTNLRQFKECAARGTNYISDSVDSLELQASGTEFIFA